MSAADDAGDVAALRAKLDRFVAQDLVHRQERDRAKMQRDEARAEVDSLRAEVERLERMNSVQYDRLSTERSRADSLRVTLAAVGEVPAMFDRFVKESRANVRGKRPIDMMAAREANVWADAAARLREALTAADPVSLADARDTCRHGEQEGECPTCAACDACQGECGVCPYTEAVTDHD